MGTNLGIMVTGNIKENDKLSINVVDDEIIIKKEKSHKTLKKRLEEFYKKPISEIKMLKEEEISTGHPVGEEIW